MIKTVKVSEPFPYNYLFNDQTGYFMRWGANADDDPQYSPIGAEILDIEVSTVCHKGCKFCYKSNTGKGKNMSIDTFKDIVDRMPTLTQIAFGIGDIDANPDLWKMFHYCREKGIVPNLTVNGTGLTSLNIELLKYYCGAVAVSNYGEECYRAVNALRSAGMDQVNIHQLLALETEDQIYKLLDDYKNGLVNVNAIVFLSLKQKGRGVGYHPLPYENFVRLVNYLLENKIPFGFDSCTACKFLQSIDGVDKYQHLVKYVEPCESGLFSSYINVDGIFYPCSFAESGKGIDVAHCDNFLDDVWYHPTTIEWRNNLLANHRSCPLYKI